ncbi:MAG: transporter [Nitrospiraceae bacterium]|nr:MAG: transporter [Nitrospiraceae bacterium]
MKKRILFGFMLAVVCIFTSHEVLAAWTQAKGHSYNSLGISHYKTIKKFSTLERDVNDELVTTHGKRFRNEEEEFTSTKLGYYGEYGITDTLTAIASFWWDTQKSNDTMRYAKEDGPSGIGDITLGLRYNLSPDLFGTGFLMSIQGEVKIPEAYKYDNPLFNLSLGDGQYDTKVALQFGRGLGAGYMVFNAGYKYRFENDQLDPVTFKPSDQVFASLSGGYAVTPWLSVIAGLDWFKSVGNAEISDRLYLEAVKGGGFTQNNKTRGELILDTLGLEPDDLQGTIGLQFNITPQWQTVLMYSRDLSGVGDFSTKNYALGETVALNLVYVH